MKRHLIVALLLFGCLLQTAVSTHAQASEPRVVIEQVDNSSFPTVSMIVTPFDAAGLPVGGLNPSQFTVLEDGQPVADLQVTQPALEDQPVSVMLVLDVSGSLRNSLSELRQSALMLYESLELFDESGVIAFSLTKEGGISADVNQLDELREAGFTNDEGLLINLINSITIEENAGAPLYDALMKGVALTQQNARHSRRAVILFTDGQDVDREGVAPGSSSYTEPTAVVQQVQQAGVPVFAIGLGNQVNGEFLQEIAAVSGGTYTPIDELTSLGGLLSGAVSAIRPAYRLTYSSQLPVDGAAHTVSVSVNTLSGTAVSETSINTPAPDLPPPPAISAVEVTPPDADSIIRVSPTLSSEAEIAAVRYVVDAEPPVTQQETPYLFEWNTAGLSLDEEHLLRIEVEDVFGQVSSITQAITIPAPPAAPTTVVTAPPVAETETAVVDEAPAAEGILAQLEAMLPFNPLFLLIFPLLFVAGLVLLLVLWRRGKKRASPPAAPPPVQAGGNVPASVPFGRPNSAAADPNATMLDPSFGQGGTPALPDANATMLDPGMSSSGFGDPNATMLDPDMSAGGGFPDANATMLDPDMSAGGGFPDANATMLDPDMSGGAAGVEPTVFGTSPVEPPPESPHSMPTVALTPPDLPSSSAKTEVLHVGDQLTPRAFFVDLNTGREYALFASGRVGRDPQNDVVFNDPSVSRLHAVFEMQGAQFVLQNQSQSNPVLVNGRVSPQAVLKDGDRLEFGRVRVTFKQKS